MNHLHFLTGRGRIIMLVMIVFLNMLNSYTLFSQVINKKQYRAVRAEYQPVIDGQLEDEVWKNGNWEGGFTQHEPYEGKEPSQKTEFMVLYDDNNIYVAVKAYDTAPDSISIRMDRRDHTDGDLILVGIDSYHDLQTAFLFGLNAAGVRMDALLSNNGQNDDESWDPVWQGKTSIQSWGWAAELKIPLTQLRFQKNGSEVWGLEIGREIFRNEEMSFWQHIPRNSPGIVHLFGELDGVQDIRPRKQFDITPYTVTSYKHYEPEENNPFMTGSETKLNAGLDAKIGITNNLTLDLTVNPDFGQVEADPSEVNLTAYETFFREKRPFFIEGSNITSFNVGLGDGDVGNDNLFYSRRIGRIPHGDPDLSENEYSKVPPVANILAAAKLTGKTEKGLSIGFLESMTSEVFATIDSSGYRRKEQIEPFSNYSMFRIRKDLNKGNTVIGAAVTNTNRRIDSNELQSLHKNASTGGFDLTQYFFDRNYRLDFSLYGSNVNGSTEAITETQQSSARYYQRPDADYITFDSSRTSLNGYGGKLQFGKLGGNWNYLFMNTWKNPGLELNDIGYMREADRILNVLWTGYSFTEPFGIFRSIFLNNDVYTVFDFGGKLNSLGYEAHARASFTNFWSIMISGNVASRNYSNTILRGGPSMELPNNGRFFVGFETNDRKKMVAEIGAGMRFSQYGYSESKFVELDLDYRPSAALNISVSPEYTLIYNELQYVETSDYNGNKRYIFGAIDQKVLGISLRLNYTISPDLTIQYWGQPFMACGNFNELKMITDHRAENFYDRFSIYSQNQKTIEDDIYQIDENTDGLVDYTFENPDFNFNEWLSNLVIRWEFRPGSTAYLVWSQTREYSESAGGFNLSENFHNLYTDQKANNVFLLKFSWRFGL